MNLHPSKLITLVIAMYCCLLTVSEAQAGCSVHDHLCSYHAIGRISTPTIAKQLGEDPSNGVYSQSGLYIKSAWATNSSGKKADLDLEVLLPDKALAEDPRTSASLLSTYVNTGPFIINGVGYPPDGNPFDGIANEAPRHVGPDQYDITFMNSTARAIHSADANGANIIGNKPGVRPCTDSENCEFVQIKGNIPAGEYRAALTNYDYYNLSDPSTPVYIITAELTDDVKAKGGVIINKSHVNGYATGSIQNPDETSEHYVFDVYNSGFAPHAEGEAYDDFKRNFYGKTKYADPQRFTDGIYNITTQKRYRDEWTNAYTSQIFSDGSVNTTNHGTVARRNNVYLGEYFVEKEYTPEHKAFLKEEAKKEKRLQAMKNLHNAGGMFTNFMLANNKDKLGMVSDTHAFMQSEENVNNLLTNTKDTVVTIGEMVEEYRLAEVANTQAKIDAYNERFVYNPKTTFLLDKKTSTIKVGAEAVQINYENDKRLLRLKVLNGEENSGVTRRLSDVEKIFSRFSADPSSLPSDFIYKISEPTSVESAERRDTIYGNFSIYEDTSNEEINFVINNLSNDEFDAYHSYKEQEKDLKDRSNFYYSTNKIFEEETKAQIKLNAGEINVLEYLGGLFDRGVLQFSPNLLYDSASGLSSSLQSSSEYLGVKGADLVTGQDSGVTFQDIQAKNLRLVNHDDFRLVADAVNPLSKIKIIQYAEKAIETKQIIENVNSYDPFTSDFNRQKSGQISTKTNVSPEAQGPTNIKFGNTNPPPSGKPDYTSNNNQAPTLQNGNNPQTNQSHDAKHNHNTSNTNVSTKSGKPDYTSNNNQASTLQNGNNPQTNQSHDTKHNHNISNTNVSTNQSDKTVYTSRNKQDSTLQNGKNSKVNQDVSKTNTNNKDAKNTGNSNDSSTSNTSTSNNNVDNTTNKDILPSSYKAGEDGSFYGPKGGKIKPTGKIDAETGKPVYQRETPEGKKGGYVVVHENGVQSSVPSPNDWKGLDTDLRRPYLRKGTRDAIDSKYEFRDDGSAIDIEKNIVVQPPLHYGHDYGWENRRILEAADQMGWDQKKLNDFVNDPKTQEHFSIQNANENMSHKGEKPGRGELQDILDSMKAFERK